MKKILIVFGFVLLVIVGCETDQPIKKDRVIIGISSEPATLNPLFAYNLVEGQLIELMYLGLVKHNWDEEISDIKTSPLIAESWEWEDDSTTITFFLKENIFWSDGNRLTAEDIVYSFDLYSDPEISSKFYGSFDNFFLNENSHIDLSKSFEVISPYNLKVKFKPGSKPTLFDIDMPIIPKHVFSKFSKENLKTESFSNELVTSGPYTLSQWRKNESITLKAAKKSFLYDDEMIKEIIFKILPNEKTRLTQLKKQEIDLLEDVSSEYISEIQNLPFIKIVSRGGRDYDYFGWNNIDPQLYSKNKGITPNKFFGSKNVRIALSHAINKEEILNEYLQGYGKLSFGPVSPIFKSYYNYEIKPYEFNLAKASELLKLEGWTDNDKDGILEKNNQKFSFKLYFVAGNNKRLNVATVAQNNLKAIGIDMTIETIEMGSFVSKLFNREFDAWLAGWTIPIPIDLKPFWYSDFEKSPFNISGFINNEADELLDKLEIEKDQEQKKILYKRIQKVIHENEPVTFLYWLDIKTAYNSRIKNIRIDPLGAIQHCWEWRITEN